MKKPKKCGFTLVEILIVVAIIGLIAAIAVPNYVESLKKSQKQACIANLRLLECAVEEVKFGGVTSVTIDMLVGDDKFIRSTPKCPVENKEYTKIDPPTCPTMPDEHSLDNIR